MTFECRQIFAIGAPDHHRHERREEGRKTRGIAAVAQCHARRPVRGRLPGVGGFHRKRPFGGPHHEAFAGFKFGDFVCVRQPLAEKLRDKGDLRTYRQPARRFPFDGLELMYQAVTLSRSAANEDTAPGGRAMTISVTTSTLILASLPDQAYRNSVNIASASRPRVRTSNTALKREDQRSKMNRSSFAVSSMGLPFILLAACAPATISAARPRSTP